MERGLTLADVREAACTLEGVAHRTPIVRSRTLDALTGANVFLKCENFQRMGAFKFRGAYNRIARLSDAERGRGVVAFSSGNHAQGVALAARLLGVPATIVMPSDAPPVKLSATVGYGAEVIEYDRLTMDRAAIARSIADERNAIVIPPFDDADVIAGQGTVALELFEDVGDLDVLLVCTGGGGLLAGCSIVARQRCRFITILGVEPELGDDWVRSWHLGRRVTIPVPATIADGQQTQAPGELTWPIVRALADGFLTVSDAEIMSAMRFAFSRLKIVTEPSGASALAALLLGKIDCRGKRVGVTISGGNVDPVVFGRALADQGAASLGSSDRETISARVASR